jgi:hypothetical protein
MAEPRKGTYIVFIGKGIDAERDKELSSSLKLLCRVTVLSDEVKAGRQGCIKYNLTVSRKKKEHGC